jgi:hypothetical protein
VGGDEVEDELVGHEGAAVDEVLRLQPERRAGGDGGAEQVAGADVRDAEVRGESGALRALPRPLAAQHDDPWPELHPRPVRRLHE